MLALTSYIPCRILDRDHTHLKAVLDEGLGVEKAMEEHLSRCHCHL